MRAAKPQELRTEAVPALKIQLPEGELSKLFPVRMKNIDPLSEPEPSKGILVRLQSGDYVVLVYGKMSETLTVLAARPKLEKTVESLLKEVHIPDEMIVWRLPLRRQGLAQKSLIKKALSRSHPAGKALRARRLTLRRSRARRNGKAEPVAR
jgi:hypothetical protein